METEPWGIFSQKKRGLKKRKYGVGWEEKRGLRKYGVGWEDPAQT